MMHLAEYRRTSTRLADFLPWAALVGEGIVLNKDGSYQRTARFRGPDLDSAVPAELVAVAGRLNNAFRRLGSGWAIFVEAQRHGAGTYPASRFPDAASALVDAERKADFEEDASHFESSYFLTFVYLPPAEDAARAESWLYEGKADNGLDPREALRGFADRTDRVLQLIENFMPECAWLDGGETLTWVVRGPAAVATASAAPLRLGLAVGPGSRLGVQFHKRRGPPRLEPLWLTLPAPYAHVSQPVTGAADDARPGPVGPGPAPSSTPSTVPLVSVSGVSHGLLDRPASALSGARDRLSAHTG